MAELQIELFERWGLCQLGKIGEVFACQIGNHSLKAG
jgi:hypothetical protein